MASAWDHALTAECLADLLAVEASARREHHLDARTRLAHPPFHKTLEAFDFAFQASIDERQIRELAQLAFIRKPPMGLGDPVIARAILDQLLHHSHVINIRGDSYPLREKRRAGLFAPRPPPLEEVRGGESRALTAPFVLR